MKMRLISVVVESQVVLGFDLHGLPQSLYSNNATVS
jgi:vacuolar-type H+-ATPase subunit F/Vma7